MNIAPDWLDMPALLRNMIHMIQQEIHNKGISIKVNLPEPMPHIWVDHRALKQMILNILSNSVKFISTGGCIIIAVNIGGDQSVELSVSDTGISIEQRDMDRVLRSLERVDDRYSQAEEGPGSVWLWSRDWSSCIGDLFISTAQLTSGQR